MSQALSWSNNNQTNLWTKNLKKPSGHSKLWKICTINLQPGYKYLKKKTALF